jgi:hypothetical protein
MDWECGNCGRVHDEDPGTCVCGSADQRQRTAGRDEDPLDTVRRLVADPSSQHLGAGGRIVGLAFRAILVVTTLVVALLAIAYLFG